MLKHFIDKSNQTPSARVAGSVLVLAIVLLTVTACQRAKTLRPAPPTYPVSGDVNTNGGSIPSGAQVEFRPERSEKSNDFTARGLIDSSGKFSLNTPFIDRVLSGAIEGSYTVRILFPSGNNPTTVQGSGLISISEKFIVKPTENHFTINLPKQ